MRTSSRAPGLKASPRLRLLLLSSLQAVGGPLLRHLEPLGRERAAAVAARAAQLDLPSGRDLADQQAQEDGGRARHAATGRDRGGMRGNGATTLSQFSSTLLPTISIAPGWMAALLSLQSWPSARKPSPSPSAWLPGSRSRRRRPGRRPAPGRRRCRPGSRRRHRRRAWPAVPDSRPARPRRGRRPPRRSCRHRRSPLRWRSRPAARACPPRRRCHPRPRLRHRRRAGRPARGSARDGRVGVDREVGRARGEHADARPARAATAAASPAALPALAALPPVAERVVRRLETRRRCRRRRRSPVAALAAPSAAAALIRSRPSTTSAEPVR